MPTISWLSPLVFSLIVLIGVLIGYWSGWRTATYFFIWNITGHIISIIVYKYAYNNPSELFPSYEIGDIDIKEFVRNNSTYFTSYIGVIYTLIFIIGFNIFALMTYWFIPPLRNLLKINIKNNKKARISSKRIRFIGMGLGAITSLIPASLSATAFSIISNEEKAFHQFNSTLTRWLSFGQYEAATDNIGDLIHLIDLANSTHLQSTLSSLFGGTRSSLNNISAEDKDKLEKILNSKIAISTINNQKLAKTFVGNENLKKIDFTKKPNPLSVSQIPLIKPENRQKIVDSIFNGILNKTSSPNATKNQIKGFLSTLLRW